METQKTNFMGVFKSRTISFNTIALLLVYGITRFFPSAGITPLDIAAIQSLMNILLRMVTDKPLFEQKE